ncbi:MAG: putative RNA-binding protein with PUA-like domain [Sphingobacteriales bacterium]|jgi:predicted RNA-binding protein with PUA-like domain
MNHWLVKSEPFKYSWSQFVKDGSTFWDGVRNYAARLHLRGMKEQDLVLFYHSNEGKEVVGIAEIIKEHYQDPTTEDDRWVAVDLKHKQALNKPVTLKQIKEEPFLENMAIIRQSRLSVMPVTKEEFDKICQMGGL